VLPDRGDAFTGITGRLHVEGDQIGVGSEERHKAEWLLDHEMALTAPRRAGRQLREHLQTQGEVRNESTVAEVEVRGPDPGALQGRQLCWQRAEVGAHDRGGEPSRRCLTPLEEPASDPSRPVHGVDLTYIR